MRTLQVVVRKLLGVFVLLSGLVLVFYSFEQILGRTLRILPQAQFFQFLAAVVLMAIGLLAVLPLFPARRKKVISFPGAHGRVDIRLDAVENSLHRVTGKMPEVKRVSLSLTPVEDNSSVRITAGLAVYKTGDEDVRELTDRIAEKIKVTAANILGIENIDVNVSLVNIIVDQPGKGAAPERGEGSAVGSPQAPTVGASAAPESEFLDEASQYDQEEDSDRDPLAP